VTVSIPEAISVIGIESVCGYTAAEIGRSLGRQISEAFPETSFPLRDVINGHSTGCCLPCRTRDTLCNDAPGYRNDERD
jgi:hypothetical protein